MVYVIFYTGINYFTGIYISDSPFKKTVFRTGIIVNLLLICLLKYYDFTINPVLNLFGLDINIGTISKIIVPIGISYLTLQGIGYLINIYFGWEKPERNFIYLLLYLSFYPKFLSGPIERSNHFLPQLRDLQPFSENQVVDGLRMCLMGIFKKIAIADQLAPYVNNAYSNLSSPLDSSLWIIWLVQPLYLYFDFSGYTDIAIGFAKTFGIELLPNFNRPFFSENMTVFWKRFHISLSSWFNDYVFKQTSFKYRKWGVAASVYAVFVTFILFGIWHGAGWTFMILGLLQALAINYEFFTKKVRSRLFSFIPEYIGVWIGRVFTYLFYCSSLVFFFSPDLPSATVFFSNLFRKNSHVITNIRSEILFIILLTSLFISFFLILEFIKNDFPNFFKRIEGFWLGNKQKNRYLRWITYCLVITILIILGNKEPQFIYFQF